MTKKCWAKALGGCDSLSGEHVVSHSVLRFGGEHVTTQGMQRVPDGPKASAGLKANILCRRHNALLSPLDATAQDVMRFAQALIDSRYCDDVVFDGRLLERWLLKTTMNSLAAGWGDELKWLPDLQVVQSIFGFVSVPEGCGLHLVDRGQMRRAPFRPLEFSFEALWTDPPESRELAGATICLNGLCFFVALKPNIVSLFPVLAKAGSDYATHAYHHRPNGVVIKRDGAAPLNVRFDWCA